MCYIVVEPWYWSRDLQKIFSLTVFTEFSYFPPFVSKSSNIRNPNFPFFEFGNSPPSSYLKVLYFVSSEVKR